ncbi:phosphoglycerate mutase [Yersinia massiliensis]|uniref:histidine phosphatase family protein n=1 Tax=Yersinia massiliensis TaxID=419257 RepID=UPI0005E172B2|nr:histidine phosphatase family protein [Yersinia massiliensis]CNH91874.1 phosphoglycerate mutase [Yersinia massiliensis]
MKKFSLLIALLSSLIFSPLTIQAKTVDDNTVTIYVTRHGKTMFNTVHRVQGWADTPLTAAGVTVAEQLGKGLKEVEFKKAYASDLGRARQTARIILTAKGQPMDVIESEKLREFCFGIYEGDLDANMWGAIATKLGYESEKALFGDFANGKLPFSKMFSGVALVDSSGEAETFDIVKARMQSELKTIAEEAAAQGGGNVLLVSHGAAILAMISDMSTTPIVAPLSNASVTTITYKNGEFTVGKIGDMSYVEKGATR